MEWLISNKEWIFSGVGVFVLGLIITYFISSNKDKQYQKSGDNSTNIQIGGNVTLGKKDDDIKK